MTNLYLDLHVLQSVPSANINRDDTGAPKKALYGGVTRARVSSQSWKRAMRLYFREQEKNTTSIRTKEVARLLMDKLESMNPELDEAAAKELALSVMSTVGVKVDKDGKTGALFMVSPGQVDKIAAYALSHETMDKKALKQIFNADQSLDLALFGRMVADDPELNVEATAQVAHAISTHEIVPEFDYFTALDDLSPEDNAGAAMLGTVEFNSSTLYRYANVNVKELIQDLGSEAAIEGLRHFIKSFLLSMPTGKQNTFANKTLPSYVMLTLREDTPVNLVSAFETPVRSNSGYVAASVARLEKEYQTTQTFVETPLLTAILGEQSTFSENKVATLPALIDTVTQALEEAAKDENDNVQA